MSDNVRGAALMMGSMAAFTFNDACMKALSDELPLFQAIFMRGVATTALLLILARASGGLRFDLPRGDWGLIALRTLAELAAAYFFISALFNMPIANATAILQALPLTVTLAGALFLGEAVGWRRMAAILAGFVGVMMIVQPGAAGFNQYSVFAVIAVGAVTVRDLAVRRMSPRAPSMTVALVASLAVTLASGAATFTEAWAPLSPTGWMQLSGASVLIIGGYLFSVMAMRSGDLGSVAPFRYTSLLWALILGLVVFGEWPDLMTLAGSAIVVAAGVFTLLRERRLGRPVAVPGLRTR